MGRRVRPVCDGDSAPWSEGFNPRLRYKHSLVHLGDSEWDLPTFPKAAASPAALQRLPAVPLRACWTAHPETVTSVTFCAPTRAQQRQYELQKPRSFDNAVLGSGAELVRPSEDSVVIAHEPAIVSTSWFVWFMFLGTSSPAR